MTQQIIDIGSAPNDGAGDPLRTAFTKANDNFTELYGNARPGGSNLQIQYNDSGAFGGMAGSSWEATKQQLSLAALSGGGADASKSTSLTVNSGNAAFDVGLTINKAVNAYSGLDIAADAVAGTFGQLLRFWTNIGGTWACPAYFDGGGGLYTRVGVFISGTHSPTTPVPGQAQTILLPSTDPAMCSIWGDVFGPMLQIRATYPDNIGAHLISGMDGLGKYVFSIESSGTIGWGVGTRAEMDTWLSRGDAGAATLQLGGPDAYALVSQTLTQQSVSAPLSSLATKAQAATPAGSAVVTFGGLQLPNALAVGMTITNSTNPNSIPAGTTVASISWNTYQVTMSNSAVGAGIASQDQLVFSAPNKAGADFIIAGSKGTGTGAGGALRFKTAAASSFGSNQNALADALVIDSAKTTTFSGKAVMAAGSVNAPSLTFSGLGANYGFYVFDAANIAFTNGTTLWSFHPSGMTFSSSAFGLQWAVSAPGGTLDLGIKRNAAGILEIDNGSAGTFRDLILRNVVGQTGYHEMVETTAPSAPSADKVRIYAEDNGAGKTRLMALFSSGAAQQIAIEP